MNFHSISLYRDYSNHLPLSNVSEVFFSQIPKNHIQVQERGVARTFQGGGEGGGGGCSHYVKPWLLTRLACRHPGSVLLNVTFFFRMSSERGWRDKPIN